MRGFWRVTALALPLLAGGAVAQTGAALITAGYAVKGNVPAAVVNGGWLLGFGTAYALEGRKRSRA